jgi:hypothetical protein
MRDQLDGRVVEEAAQRVSPTTHLGQHEQQRLVEVVTPLLADHRLAGGSDRAVLVV